MIEIERDNLRKDTKIEEKRHVKKFEKTGSYGERQRESRTNR